ncbi:MAG: rRNA pseudouridine synthase [Gammaproteobacteria bacterium AqS3]|nr:rRNA pseudouridine synthase [Gammaproteobacteria bacterium AqS3]
MSSRRRRRAAGRSAPSERIQKVLAGWGIGSRRQIEEWIRTGRLCVDGKPIPLGHLYRPGSRLQLDGKPIEPPASKAGASEIPQEVLIYHKPEGILCTRSDPQRRPTVFDKLPKPAAGRWVQVGRLDLNSSGLMLFTTDGVLANRLMHPSSNIDREYLVRIFGRVDEAVLERLRQGVMLDDGKRARFTDIQPTGEKTTGENRWFSVVVMEGRNREVRKLWESQGLRVTRLKRVRFGPVHLPFDLHEGRHRLLSSTEMEVLFEDLDRHASA